MKKIVAVTVLFLLLGASGMNPLMAQEGSKIGFRASPLISWGNITDRVTKAKPASLETKAAMGFNFDFVYTYGFSENVGIKTGITLSTRGIKSSVALPTSIGGKTSLDSKLGITSVIVPVGFKFRSPEIGDGMFIYGVFGVDAELNVQNKIVGEYIQLDTVNSLPSLSVYSNETRDNEGISIFTASFAPGAGLDWQFDWGMLEFGLTYNWGLMSYTTKKFMNQDQVTKMNSIGLNLGYFF
jgi:Outer membrane protein beta-barrel domain